MDKTLAVFRFESATERSIGRIDWIYELSPAKTLNNRINRNQKHLIFWSPNINRQPDFSLPISNVYFNDRDGMYRGKILKCFGEIHSIVFTLKIVQL